MSASAICRSPSDPLTQAFVDCGSSKRNFTRPDQRPNRSSIRASLRAWSLLDINFAEAPGVPLSGLEGMASKDFGISSWSGSARISDSSDFSRVEPIPKGPSSPFLHIEEL